MRLPGHTFFANFIVSNSVEHPVPTIGMQDSHITEPQIDPHEKETEQDEFEYYG